MNLGDVLVKIAINRNLSQQEIDFLRLEGNNTQSRNSFVAGNTTPSNTLNVQFPFAPIYNEVLAVDTASPESRNVKKAEGSSRSDSPIRASCAILK